MGWDLYGSLQWTQVVYVLGLQTKQASHPESNITYQATADFMWSAPISMFVTAFITKSSYV